MDNSYALKRPGHENTVPIKKQRQGKYINSVAQTDTSFNYSCYNCNHVIQIILSDVVEIECTECGSRVLKKGRTKKTHMYNAI